MMTEELYKLKIASLLHDPPSKPYLVAKRESHEKEAEKYAKTLFGEDIVKYLYDPRISFADKVASSFDRWILSMLMGDKYVPGLFHSRTVKLKNIVEPTLEHQVSLDEVREGKLEEQYLKELRNVISYCQEWRAKYHVFYALYELLWIKNELKVGPADTRTPTHTVFDHNYATAAIINWVYEKEGKIAGLLVGIDVTDVQEFVSSSRKIRDMWASSYIVSALTWYTLIELIEKLGPDVVLMPSLRMNPFYLYWLKTKFAAYLSKEIHDVERIVYLTKEVIELYEELGLPPYPILPGRATLILPPWDLVRNLLGTNSDIEEYIEERFRKGWELLWKAIEKLACRAKDADFTWKLVHEALSYYEEELGYAGFECRPPLGLRVAVVNVDEDLGKSYDKPWEIYDRKYRELVVKLGKEKYARKAPAIELSITSLTKKAFEGKGLGFPVPSKKGFDFCTSCGKLPALMVLPRNAKDYQNKIKEVLGSDINPYVLSAIEAVLSRGEKLCPWCFIKRAISLRPSVLKLLLCGESDVEQLTKVALEEVEVTFPSTSHVASTRLYEKILEKAEKLIPQVSINDHIPGSPVALEIKSSMSRKQRTHMWIFMKRLGKHIHEKAKNLEKRRLGDELILYAIYNFDPEETWFHEDRRRNWEKLLSDTGLNKWLYRYYALIRADGDYIGDLLEGKLTAFVPGELDEFYLKTSPSELNEKELKKAQELLKQYIENSCEGELQKFIKFCLKEMEGENTEEAGRIWANLIARKAGVTVDEAKRRIENVISTLKYILEEKRKLPVTPSYHVTISSALMRAAVLDIALVARNDGFVVYAGGDDLLALVPIDRALDVVSSTRLSYSGLKVVDTDAIELSKGFLKLKESWLPMLPSICRSYCVYIAHYHYPLSIVISGAAQLLDHAKEDLVLEYFDVLLEKHRSRKDVLVIAYSPRGREECVVLPISWQRPVIQRAKNQDPTFNVTSVVRKAKRLLELVDDRLGEGILRHSLIYDFKERDFKNLILALADKLNEIRDPQILDTILRLVAFIVRRNIDHQHRSAKEVCKEVFDPLLGNYEENKISSDPIGLGVFVDKRTDHRLLILLNLIDSIKAIRSGMR